MNTLMFSIIIPCYNTAQYLGKCLESVIAQTYQNLEIIIVNDGSSDNTEDIIRHYAEHDYRVKVLSQQNQGLSVARNNGIKEAKGDYILFLDSDDWYKDKSFLEHLSKKIEDVFSDIIVFGYQCVTEDGYVLQEDCIGKYFEQLKNIYSGQQYLYQVLSFPVGYIWYSVRYAFNRKFWVDNQFEFRLRRFEDLDIIYSILLKAQKIAVLDEVGYQYRIAREGSLSMVSKQLMQDLIYVMRDTINTVNNMDIDAKLKRLLKSNFSRGYYSILSEVNQLKKEDRKEVFDLLIQNRSLMSYAIRGKYLIVKWLSFIFGLHITSKLLFLWFKVQKNGKVS